MFSYTSNIKAKALHYGPKGLHQERETQCPKHLAEASTAHMEEED